MKTPSAPGRLAAPNDDAGADAAFGVLANSRQIFMGTERSTVEAKVDDVFVDEFVTKAESLPLGDPREP